MKLGNLDISAFKVGSGDCSIYLGTVKLYPQEPPTFNGKFYATYSDGTSYSAECDGNTDLTTATTRAHSTPRSAMTEAIIGDCVTNVKQGCFYEFRIHIIG